jgi:hypothetical protein
MGLLENGGLFKGSATVALWGLGIYVGLCVAAPLLTGVARPLAKEAARGYQSLRTRLKRAARGEAAASLAGEEIVITGGAAAVPAGEIVTAGEMEMSTPPPAEETGAPGVAVESPAAAPVAATRPQRVRKTVVRNAGPVSSWSKAALYAKAKQMKIAGRSAMSRKQLLDALEAAEPV